MRLFIRLEGEKKSCVKLVKLIVPGYLLMPLFVVIVLIFLSIMLLMLICIMTGQLMGMCDRVRLYQL